MSQSQPSGDPPAQTEGAASGTIDPEGSIGPGGLVFPVGSSMPIPEHPDPRPEFWEVHTSESWAKAIQTELMQMAAAPTGGVVPDPTVPLDEVPFDVNVQFFPENIKFQLVRLRNGKLGFAVSFAHVATPDMSNWVHHMVVLGR
jgi:hypothetical protein